MINKTPQYLILHLIFICALFNTAIAQDRLGIVGSNFAGSQGIMINPSSIINSKLYMDINLASFDFSAQNNYLYIPKDDYSLGSLTKEIRRNIDYYDEYNNWMPRDSMRFNEVVYQHGNKANLFMNATVMGPSAFYSKNDQAFGFYSSFRNNISERGLPFHLANFLYKGFDYEEQYGDVVQSSDYSAAAASWLELGFTYARVLKKNYNKHLSGGITLKRMFSYAASFVDVDNLDYTITSGGDAEVTASDFRFGYALPVEYESNEYFNNLKKLGKGWGFDLGITYQLKTKGYENNNYEKACEQEFEPYIFKLGVSLLDIGSIKYNSNARLHEYSGPMEWPRLDTMNFRSVYQISTELDNHYYEDNPGTSLKDTTFSIGLPTTLSVQADYHYHKNIYFGGLLMLPLKISKYQIRRPSLIAFMPRFETQRFEISTPLSLYDFNELRLGLSVRYGAFTIGTDKLGAFLGASNFDGFDLYFMIKINFLKGRCANEYNNVCN